MKAAIPSPFCPVTKTAELLSDTWTILIIHALLQDSKRFCEIERELVGISTRTLTLKLKKLEAEGMIHKSPDGTYQATAKGKGLKTVERAMKTYGEKFLRK
jgi:DNA-binding HxlR family transcriptional regulator